MMKEHDENGKKTLQPAREQGQKPMRAPDEMITQLGAFMLSCGLADVIALDLRGISDVADYFLCATVHSAGQLRGSVKRLHEYFYRHNIACRGGKKQQDGDDLWLLLDCEYFVIHLMIEDAREYYDIEGFWTGRGARLLETFA